MITSNITQWFSALIPVVAILSVKLFGKRFPSHYLVFPGVAFAIHNGLYVIGVSLRGEMADYVVFLAEYFWFCYGVWDFCYRSRHVRIGVRALRATAIVVLNGIIGVIFAFNMCEHFGYESAYNFTFKGETYQSRMFWGFDFAWSDTKPVTIVTYRIFPYVVMEHRIHTYHALSPKNILNFSDPKFAVQLDEIQGKRKLSFHSSEVFNHQKQVVQVLDLE